MNRAHRRLLKARERMVESFKKQEKARLIAEIQAREHREAVKRRILKQTKKK